MSLHIFTDEMILWNNLHVAKEEMTVYDTIYE